MHDTIQNFELSFLKKALYDSKLIQKCYLLFFDANVDEIIVYY